MASSSHRQRAYRTLLLLLPRELREEYGEDMVQLFVDRSREPVSRVRLWCGAVRDVAQAAVAERASRFRASRRGLARRGRYRQKGWPEMVDRLGLDGRYALRILSRSPGFAALAVGTFALAVGANTAIFGILNGVLFEPLPFGRPDELVAVWETSELEGVAKSDTSAGLFLDWREKNQTLEDLTAWTFDSVVVQGDEGTESLTAVLVYPNFFSVLGLDPYFGRGFAYEDAPPGTRGKVVILSHSLWRERFGADPSIVGRTLRIDGAPHDVVAVMRPDVAAPVTTADLWIPVAFRSPSRWERHNRRLYVTGRLREGVPLEQAQQDFSRIAVEMSTGEYEDIYEGWDARLVPLQEEIVGNSRPALATALAAVALVLLIACVNIANLLLARTADRKREIALRTAIGAGRGRLVGQLLTESLLLAACGGALGLVVAFALHRALLSLQPGIIPRVEELSLDLHAFAFAAAVTAFAGISFGLAPALHGLRLDVQRSLQQGGSRGSTEGRGLSRTRAALVAGQLALATVLLCGAGLFLRTLVALSDVDPGFRTDNRVAIRFFLDTKRYGSDDGSREYFARLVSRIDELSSVRAVGASSALPMDPVGINYDLPYRLAGQGELSDNQLPQADFRVVTPGYFEALGVPLASGRSFDGFDRPDNAFVAIVNESMAKIAWPGASPIGRRFETPSTGWRWFEVVGVVADTRFYGPRSDPRPEIYVAHSQVPRANMTLVVETARDPALVLESLRRAVLEEDPAQPMHSMVTMDSLAAGVVARERFYAVVLGAFAALALTLAAAGVFGVLSYWVAARTQEIGVRMALGASRLQVLRVVLAKGAALGSLGALVGLGAAFGSTRVVESVLFHVSATDLATFFGVAVLLLVTALAACTVPALRASRVDPIVALREE